MTVVVEGPLLCGQDDAVGPRPAARELQADRAAAVADHDLGQQRVQLVDVARRQLVAAVDELALELLRRAQQARLQQRDQVEQLLEVVLHRGGRQQQDELLLQLAGELPRPGWCGCAGGGPRRR